MIIVTKNSSYLIEPCNSEFVITKVAAYNTRSMFMAIGESRRSQWIAIAVGHPAKFDGWQTSEVTCIRKEGE